jgi:hypothetical protein
MAQLVLCALMAFPVGERLVYKVKYGPLTAGSLTLEVAGVEEVAGESCYHLVSHLVSNPSYSSLFFLSDMIESWCRTSDFVTLRTHKAVHEGKYRDDVTVDFDYGSNTADYSDSTHCHIHSDSRDMLSLWYYFRTAGLEPGDTLSTWSHVDKKNYSVSVSAGDEEHVSTRAGEFDCLVIDLNSSGPAASGRVYLSDDDESLPVIIRTRLPLGYVTASLSERDERE